jgi:molecular chaperone IbpA
VVDARLENGLLHIELRREIPEAMKPRTIEIRGDAGKLIEGQPEHQADREAEKARAAA